jgi:hypothetical protein
VTTEQREALSDKVADVLWWVSGWIAAQGSEAVATIDVSHVAALRETRVLLKGEALTVGDLALVRRLDELKKDRYRTNITLREVVGDLIILRMNLDERFWPDVDRVVEKAREVLP